MYINWEKIPELKSMEKIIKKIKEINCWINNKEIKLLIQALKIQLLLKFNKDKIQIINL